jgi:hypothetical protein
MLPQPCDRQGSILAGVVPHGEPPGHGITGCEEAVRQPERLEYQRGDGPLVGQTRNLLKDPPSQVVPRLAVGGPDAGRRYLLQLSQLRFTIREQFTRLLSPLIARAIPDLQPGFHAYANGLKEAAEGQHGGGS